MKQPTAPIYPDLPSEELSPAENIRDRKTTHQGERCEEGLIQKV